MRQVLFVIVLAALCGCATKDGSQRHTAEKVDNQAIVDFIAVRQLEELEKLRSTERDGWDILTMTYVIYKTRRHRYLIEFARPCYELRDNTEVTPDFRANANVIRAKFDTLRGCRIARLYALSPEEADELENIGEAPGNRN